MTQQIKMTSDLISPQGKFVQTLDSAAERAKGRSAGARAIKYMAPGKVLVAAVTFQFALTLVPPSIYERYINEPDTMFGNVYLYLFVLASAIILGLGISAGCRAPSYQWHRIKSVIVVNIFTYLLLPILIALLLVVTTIYLVVKNDPALLIAALSGQGSIQ